MTTAEERQRASDVVRSVLAAYERAGQRPPHDDEIVAAACEEDAGVSETLARDALQEQRRKERTLLIEEALAGAPDRDLDEAMCIVADQGLPNATVREVVAVLFEGCTDEERREFEEGLDLDRTADAWQAG